MSEKINMHQEQHESREKLPKPVYYIESPNDDTVLIGIGVEIERRADNTTLVSWHDTTHIRKMRAEDSAIKDDYFAFRRAKEEGGGEYYFQPMSIEIYNKKVKERLVDGGDYDNEDELNQAFLETVE
jgi:hypothetical protein